MVTSSANVMACNNLSVSQLTTELKSTVDGRNRSESIAYRNVRTRNVPTDPRIALGYTSSNSVHPKNTSDSSNPFTAKSAAAGNNSAHLAKTTNTQVSNIQPTSRSKLCSNDEKYKLPNLTKVQFDAAVHDDQVGDQNQEPKKEIPTKLSDEEDCLYIKTVNLGINNKIFTGSHHQSHSTKLHESTGYMGYQREDINNNKTRIPFINDEDSMSFNRNSSSRQYRNDLRSASIADVTQDCNDRAASKLSSENTPILAENDKISDIHHSDLCFAKAEICSEITNPIVSGSNKSELKIDTLDNKQENNSGDKNLRKKVILPLKQLRFGDKGDNSSSYDQDSTNNEVEIQQDRDDGTSSLTGIFLCIKMDQSCNYITGCNENIYLFLIVPSSNDQGENITSEPSRPVFEKSELSDAAAIEGMEEKLEKEGQVLGITNTSEKSVILEDRLEISDNTIMDAVRSEMGKSDNSFKAENKLGVTEEENHDQHIDNKKVQSEGIDQIEMRTSNNSCDAYHGPNITESGLREKNNEEFKLTDEFGCSEITQENSRAGKMNRYVLGKGHEDRITSTILEEKRIEIETSTETVINDIKIIKKEPEDLNSKFTKNESLRIELNINNSTSSTASNELELKISNKPKWNEQKYASPTANAQKLPKQEENLYERQSDRDESPIHPNIANSGEVLEFNDVHMLKKLIHMFVNSI
ncbi:uncharacterized protein TRIADDRAFT_52888 [Trichoplax adhaerens]|uniref:Uncharacterized protein n=1 Tax=Trichoplax adhaerens TaxID=10228 RepID=B3RMQ7_TRIAD|nr:hypothetical protein TRIADDRAFT_52888 [Trichoplax adhaerens]EDV27319.1 hypothetical protein TRIADDRAFT_52888 [Trichoplax adhaerens]|eukprot:XP_002109153.1 hypothetical protein TRIADDRAFT_52888 [Trichoplax adhaerens]